MILDLFIIFHGIICKMLMFTGPLLVWWFSHQVVSDSLIPHGQWPDRFLCPWDSPGKNTGVGSHFLLHRIFPTHESNLGLLHCRQILYQLGYKGSPIASLHKYNFFFCVNLYLVDFLNSCITLSICFCIGF